MNILAFDTTTSACAVAVCRQGDAVAEEAVSLERGHAEILLPMIERVLTNSGMRYGDLNAIAVTRGPGAFTGIRIGLAAARGLSLATGLPAVGVTTLQAMAATAVPQTVANRIAVAIDTKRHDFFLQIFDRNLEALSEPEVVTAEMLGEALAAAACNGSVALAGDGQAHALANLPVDIEPLSHILTPAPACIAQIAASHLDQESGAEAPTPLYLRPPEARLPRAP